MQQQNKDLQYFVDQAVKEYEDEEKRRAKTKPLMYIAAERYAAYREQQAKDAAFSLDDIKKAISMARSYTHDGAHGDHFYYSEEDIIMTVCPYREKGGVDGIHKPS